MHAREEIIPGDEPSKRNFVGEIVSFDLRRSSGKITREKGEITAQQWLGFTSRGRIPEYEVTILGKSGRSILARVTEDHVIEID